MASRVWNGTEGIFSPPDMYGRSPGTFAPPTSYQDSQPDTRGKSAGAVNAAGLRGVSRAIGWNARRLASLQIASDETNGDIQSVITALDAGRLHADMNDVKGQLRALATDGCWKDSKSRVLRASPELVKLLAGLVAKGNAMTIMSLFRFKNTAHGQVQPDGSAVGHAVDIMEYGGFKIHLKNPNNADAAISGVAAVIENLPAGKYTLGLPRPGGGPVIDPEHDVFLPVTSLDQVQKSPSRGHLDKDLEAMHEPARAAVRAALASNTRARVQFLYPDGVDHIHITAVS